jgi:hypothetical protein
MAYDDDDVPLHPRVRQAILEGNRDLPLTLNWVLTDPRALDFLGLPDLNPLAMQASNRILAEVLAQGDRFISYSRRYDVYSGGQRHINPLWTRAAILPAIAQLTDADFIEHERMPPGHRGMQSRFRASPKLLAATSYVEIMYEPMEIIIIRDVAGHPTAYRDNREIRAMRNRLQEINDQLIAQQMGRDGHIIRQGDRLANGGRVQKVVYRVFNRSSIECGGRHVGGSWQNTPAEQRLLLEINGQSVVEVDYNAMHVHLLYQEIGKPMPGDPYDLAEWPRKYAKAAMLLGINAKTPMSAIRALADALRLDGRYSYPFPTAKALLKAIKAKHPDIAHAFGSDAGVRLMRQDSDLASRIMWEMLRTTGIVPLPVHDSFIVPSTYEDRLREIMESATPCPTTTKFPCGTTNKNPLWNMPENGAGFSLESPIVSPKNVPQYGMGLGGVVLSPVALWGWGGSRRYELSTDPRAFQQYAGVSRCLWLVDREL